MIGLLEISNYVFLYYYLVANLFYLGLMVESLFANISHRRRLASLRLEALDDSPFTAPVSIIVPAHNEEATIVESIVHLQAMEYPALQIVVVNDGSSDATLARLTEAFGLRPVQLVYVPRVKCAPVRGIYSSSREPRLLVVDKVAGGSKADATNAGINAATSPYICVIDADSLLEPDALRRIMADSYSEVAPLVATGGIVRVLNGSRIGPGGSLDARVPRRPLETVQVIEYLRSFLVGRAGWASNNVLPIISGAFGVFHRDLVIQVGGYRSESIGEDFDLVVRLHRRLLEMGWPYRIRFVPEPTCWTQVPSDFSSLGRQRARWQNGLADVLWRNRDVLFRPRFGAWGMVMLPYLWVFELLAPVVELLGYATILTAAVLGVLQPIFLLEFLLYGYAFATMISIGSVLLEEVTYKRYARAGDVALLIVCCFLEHFPYRQIHLVWRLIGLWQYLRGDNKWKEIRRASFAPTP